VKLLENEKIGVRLKPAKLAFIKHYSVSILYLMSAYLLFRIYNTGLFLTLSQDLSISPEILGAVTFSLLFLISGFILSLEFINRLPLVVSVGGMALGLYLNHVLSASYAVLLPSVYLFYAVLSFVLITLYANSHTYLITNERIIIKKSFISRTSRDIFYEKLSDITLNQGLLGRIFNFGDIVPITQSSFGLGDTTTFAGAGASTGKRLRLGIFGGGAKGTQEPRARSYYQLFGVENPSGIKHTIAQHMHSHSPIPYLQNIEKGLGDMNDIN